MPRPSLFGVVFSVIVLGFAAIPSAKVAPYREYVVTHGEPHYLFTEQDSTPVPGTEKSGLWMAIEGRLKWLGVL